MDNESVNEERLRLGINFIELIWSEVLRKIVEKAIEVYELNLEQSIALRKAFLSRNLLRFIPA